MLTAGLEPATRKEGRPRTANVEHSGVGEQGHVDVGEAQEARGSNHEQDGDHDASADESVGNDASIISDGADGEAQHLDQRVVYERAHTISGERTWQSGNGHKT